MLAIVTVHVGGPGDVRVEGRAGSASVRSQNMQKGDGRREVGVEEADTPILCSWKCPGNVCSSLVGRCSSR